MTNCIPSAIFTKWEEKIKRKDHDRILYKTFKNVIGNFPLSLNVNTKRKSDLFTVSF